MAHRVVLALLLLVPIIRAQERPPLPDAKLADLFLMEKPPFGLPDEATPPYDTATPLQVELGKRLFFDPILSADRTVSCASCHEPDSAFASNQKLPLGIGGKRAARNSPTLFNRGFSGAQFWDGRAEDLDHQALMPIEDPNEMGLPVDEALKRLAATKEYEAAFRAAFERGPDRSALGRAIAAFVSRLWLGDSPVDRFRAADVRFLNDKAKTGLWIYESKGRCWRCHVGPNFSDESFHNTGIGAKAGVPEEGRFKITKKDEDRGRFKTPTLRGLTLTAPYMHDGSIATLEDVVAFYRRGGEKNTHLDEALEPIDLTDDEATALTAFLKALSERVPPGTPFEFGNKKRY